MDGAQKSGGHPIQTTVAVLSHLASVKTELFLHLATYSTDHMSSQQGQSSVQKITADSQMANLIIMASYLARQKYA